MSRQRNRIVTILYRRDWWHVIGIVGTVIAGTVIKPQTGKTKTHFIFEVDVSSGFEQWDDTIDMSSSSSF